MEKNIKELAHKITFLAGEYEKEKIGEVASIFQVPHIDFEVAAREAVAEGLLEIDEETKVIKVVKKPDTWAFTEADIFKHLTGLIVRFLEIADSGGDDMEEEIFSNYLSGYPPQDVLIALRTLVNEKKVATYTLKDFSDSKGKKEVNEYVFFTLPGKEGEKRGKKQFKNPKKVK